MFWKKKTHFGSAKGWRVPLVMVSRHLPESSQLLLLLIASVHADNKVAALGINHEDSCVLDLNSLKTGVILPRLLNCHGDHSRKCTRRRQRKSQNMEMPHCPVLCSHRLGSPHIWLSSMDLRAIQLWNILRRVLWCLITLKSRPTAVRRH